MTEKLQKHLNQQVANFTVLYEKLHHYHWYVKGKQFFTLHEQFQKDYEEVTELVDELAEHLIIIGGSPVSSLKEYLEVTTLEENQKQAKTANTMVTQLIADYKQLVKELTEAIDEADDVDDDVAEDLLINIKGSLQKKIWFYTSFNSK